ncbi:hypothetical protein LQV05_004717 [Cryptococcus neoformans]|nr:hypothetical protein C356_03901 [Cryptococcus neoformans var. grubii c45]OXB36420.1 hypothetical protein J007_03844 [Cryptococcus neoformans var. grubii]OXC60615.1 hypothetical protein C358_03939 [Cryptococcus neoformans var. grubii MW-RSA852]UOH82034.1 hypothetical protein LQV05_004717 [Cryptococcus neoformans]
MSSQAAQQHTVDPPAVAQIVDPNNPNAVPPPSIVAAGTGLPAAPREAADSSQEAATAPGGGNMSDHSEKLSFKEQVNGYAKKFAGATFRNPEEKEWGEKKLAGDRV